MEKPENPEITTLFQLLKKALPISLNYFIDYIPFTITLILFKYLGDTKTQEILGLSLTYFNFSFGHLIGIQDVVGIRCSKEFGKKDFKSFWTKFFVFILIDLFLLIFSVISVVFSGNILNFAGIENEISENLVPLLLKLLIIKIIENFNNLLKGILVAQKISQIFFYTNLISVSLFSFLSFLFIINFNFGINGFVFAFFIKIITENIMLLTILSKKNKIKFYLPNFKNLFSDFFPRFKIHSLHFNRALW